MDRNRVLGSYFYSNKHHFRNIGRCHRSLDAGGVNDGRDSFGSKNHGGGHIWLGSVGSSGVLIDEFYDVFLHNCGCCHTKHICCGVRHYIGVYIAVERMGGVAGA
jgi:hypothetical protein